MEVNFSCRVTRRCPRPFLVSLFPVQPLSTVSLSGQSPAPTGSSIYARSQEMTRLLNSDIHDATRKYCWGESCTAQLKTPLKQLSSWIGLQSRLLCFGESPSDD